MSAPRFERVSERVYRWADTCASYVVTSGDRALVVDLGAGELLEHLPDIGVARVDYVLHTHHHRDQCQGDGLLDSDAQIVVPAGEAQFFADAEALWESVSTFDLYDVSNTWNRPARNIDVARALRDYETLAWTDLAFLALPTPGHTRGSLTYVAEIDGVTWAFCGDLLHSAGRVWTIHDMQWSYLGNDGLNTTLRSVRTLAQRGVERLAPSHGPVADDAKTVLDATEQNLNVLWDSFAVGFAEIWEPVTPPLEPHFFEISEHLVTVLSSVAHFHVLHADGHALFFDYGFASWDHAVEGGFRFVEHSLDELRARYGIEHVDIVVPSHYHDDHVCGIPFLQERFGCEVWAYDLFADFLERPQAFRVPCLWSQPIRVTRRVQEGEEIEWRGFRFTARHNPGHTWYAAVWLGEVDGVRVAICGDEFERDREKRLRGAGPIYRNRVTLGSFPQGIATIRAHEPQFVLTGHIGASPVDAADFDDASTWSENLEGAWRELAAFPDGVGFALDPDAVSFQPYASAVDPGQSVDVEVEVRNYFDRDASAELRLVLPPDWSAQQPDQTVLVPAEGTVRASFTVTAPHAAAAGRHVVTVDATIGGHRFGEAAEALLRVASR